MLGSHLTIVHHTEAECTSAAILLQAAAPSPRQCAPSSPTPGPKMCCPPSFMRCRGGCCQRPLLPLTCWLAPLLWRAHAPAGCGRSSCTRCGMCASGKPNTSQSYGSPNSTARDLCTSVPAAAWACCGKAQACCPRLQLVLQLCPQGQSLVEAGRSAGSPGCAGSTPHHDGLKHSMRRGNIDKHVVPRSHMYVQGEQSFGEAGRSASSSGNHGCTHTRDCSATLRSSAGSQGTGEQGGGSNGFAGKVIFFFCYLCSLVQRAVCRN